MNFEIDKASLDLIAQLQLEDAENLIKGKHAEGEAPDGEFAAKLFKDELEQLQISLADNIMCRSIAQAMLTDGNVIQSSILEERRAAHDRARLDGSHATLDDLPESVIDDELMGKLAIMFIGADELSDGAHAESSSQGAKANAKHTNTRQCTGCAEDVAYIDTVRCPCSHDFCRECIAALFQAAINDESRFPARCCRQPIPLGLNQIFLPSKLVGQYRAKEIEYAAPNRTYCHQSSCSTFIPPQFIQESTATCVKFSLNTCTSCKHASHEGDCPPDAATLGVLQLANELGWQRCSSCRNVVELNTGCNHITCRCGAQFCYVCGETWKTCGCAQWHEARLLDRANAIVDRDEDAGLLDDEQRAVQVELEQQNLRDNHQCAHTTWRSRTGAFRCDDCRDQLPRYIYECTGCRILACRTCRRHRL